MDIQLVTFNLRTQARQDGEKQFSFPAPADHRKNSS